MFIGGKILDTVYHLLVVNLCCVGEVKVDFGDPSQNFIFVFQL